MSKSKKEEKIKRDNTFKLKMGSHKYTVPKEFVDQGPMIFDWAVFDKKIDDDLSNASMLFTDEYNFTIALIVNKQDCKHLRDAFDRLAKVLD